MKNNFLKKKVEQLQYFKNYMGETPTSLFSQTSDIGSRAKIYLGKRSCKTTSWILIWHFYSKSVVLWKRSWPTTKFQIFLRDLGPPRYRLLNLWCWKREQLCISPLKCLKYWSWSTFFSEICFSIKSWCVPFFFFNFEVGQLHRTFWLKKWTRHFLKLGQFSSKWGPIEKCSFFLMIGEKNEIGGKWKISIL